MNHLDKPSTSRLDDFEDDEIFEDSAFLANFDNTSFKQTNFSPHNLNNTINNSALNVSALCCDEEISGYDKLTGKTWIYPTNYPVRDYQFNIIKAALAKNTLVSLPTGLGKTFIAAVIMYNFYRWYPLGKIVFTAPTRPLVAQQIDACYNIIAIPPKDTIEMTGHMQVNTRKAHWENKRVFFATPQVIYNDLKSGICPADQIRCLVIDEAHKARGNYAYCQIVATLDEMGHKTYRMLALSATPGSKVDDVINVVKSLHIAHLELRTENCIDVAPYSHSRKITTEIVELGSELTRLRQQYVEILDFYARRLKQFSILPQNLGNLSKGRIVMLYKEYQTKDRGSRHPQHNYIMKDFTLLIALYHGLELLVKHGSRVFLNFFDEHPEKTWIQSDDKLTALLERLRDDLGVNPLSLDRSILPDGTVPEMPKDLCFGHPKFDKLKTIVLNHFTRAKQENKDTRAIIFCEYRESVNLVHCLLLQCRPLIVPQMFVGQGASGKDGKAVVSQKQQLLVMRKFRDGACNTLVATCVAEEGLDVGSVDLIVCFDISTSSPIRLVQRCGRTGRERGGQVFILVTEGREHQTLMDCMRQRDGLNKRISQSKDVKDNLYQQNPRMMPLGFTPECHKMFITVAKKDDSKDKEKPAATKKGQKNLRTMLLNNKTGKRNASPSTKEGHSNCLITEDEFKELYPDGFQDRHSFRIPDNYWSLNKEAFKIQAMEKTDTNFNLTSWLEWQRTLQKTVNVDHSKDSEFLVNTLQKCDSKRLEPTYNQVANRQELFSQRVSPTLINQMRSPKKTSKTTKKKQKAPVTKSPAKNCGDIRALFCTTTKSTKSYTKLINDLGIQNDGSVSTSMINLLVDLNLNVENTNDRKNCYICQNICDCKLINNRDKSDTRSIILTNFLRDPILPDLNLLKDISAGTIRKYISDTNASQDPCKSDSINTTATSKDDKHNCSDNFSLEFDIHELEEIKSPQENVAGNKSEINLSTDKNFDIGDIGDIFTVSSSEEAPETKESTTKKVEENAPEKALDFFGLDSLEDIFADYDDDEEIPKSQSPLLQNTRTLKDKPAYARSPKQSEQIFQKNPIHRNNIIQPFPDKNVPNSDYPLSPSLLSGRMNTKAIPTSPILCSQARKCSLSIKKKKPQSSTPNSTARKKLSLSEHDNNNVITDIKILDKEKNNKTSHSVGGDTTDKSMFTVTQLVEMINNSDNKSINHSNLNTKMNVEDERSTSPILLTQVHRKRTITNINNITDNYFTSNKSKSLIIVSSDSDTHDSSDTEEQDKKQKLSKINDSHMVRETSNPVVVKRKFRTDDEVTASPHFHKKPKLDTSVELPRSKEPLTVQEKILAVMSSNQTKKFSNNQNNFNFTVTQPSFPSQKENIIPLIEKSDHFNDSQDEKVTTQNPLDRLQKYRKENLVQTQRNQSNLIIKTSPKKSPTKRNIFEDCDDIMFDDKLLSPEVNPSQNSIQEYTPIKRNIYFGESDDDFINGIDSPAKPGEKTHETRSTINRKVRKKRKHNSFIDMEASMSSADDSGDELTDDSAGSIVQFIDDHADATGDDIHAVYLKSVRSPVKKNGFKIPEHLNKYKKEDVLSQFVEEDAYEMDSFCVDSDIGLTQVNEVSDLELAEMVLEEKRRSKKKRRSPIALRQENGDSPITRKTKNSKRQINSDSDDST